MTIPGLTNAQLMKLLSDNGYKVVSNEFWNDHDRVIVEKDGATFPVQYKTYYYYPIIIKLCAMLEIDPPEDCMKCHLQWKAEKEK